MRLPLLEKRRHIPLCVTAFLLSCALAVPAYADGGWRQEDGIWYYYDENGEMQTGWIQDPDSGLWYDLDLETGAWIRKPRMDETAAKYLLENAIKKAGYYQDEDYPVEIVVTSQDKWTICASVRILTGPNSHRNLNSYVINRKTGLAAGMIKADLELYK